MGVIQPGKQLVALSDFGVTGFGDQYGNGPDETSRLADAFRQVSGENVTLDFDSVAQGGTNIYIFSRTLTLSPYVSIRSNGAILKAAPNFTADSSGFAVTVNNTLNTNKSTNLHGRGSSTIELNVWGSNALNSQDKPALTATGAVFTGTISGTTLTVGTVASGTIAAGMTLSGDPAGGIVGVIPGTYIVANLSGSGNGSTWQVSNKHTKAISSNITMTATNDPVLNGIGVSQVNGVDFDFTVVGFNANAVFTDTNWYTCRIRRLMSYQATDCGLGFSATNGGTGENVKFYGGVVANCSNSMGSAVGVREDGTTKAEIVLPISIDYCDKNVVWGSGYVEVLNPGHNENGNNNPLYYIACTASFPKTRAKIGNLAPAFNATGYAPAALPGGRPALIQADNGPSLDIDSIWSAFGQPYSLLLKETNGSVTSARLKGFADNLANGTALAGGRFNLVSNPTFDSGNTLPGWSLDVTPTSNTWNFIRNGAFLGATNGGGWNSITGNNAFSAVSGVTATVAPNFNAVPPTLVINLGGTAGSTGTCIFYFEGSTTTPAAPNQIWVGEIGVQALSTTALASVDTVGCTVTFYNSAGSFLSSVNSSQIAITNSSGRVVASVNSGPLPANTAFIRFGLTVHINAAAGVTGALQIDSAYLSMAGNPQAPSAATAPALVANGNPSMAFNPIRYGLTTTPAPHAGSHNLMVQNLTGTGAAWPVASGSAPAAATYPGLKTTIPVRPGESVLAAGHVQGSYIGGAGYLIAFRDASGAAIGNASTVGGFAAYNTGTLTVAAGLAAGETITVNGTTFTASSGSTSGTSFGPVNGTVANDAPILLAALQASGSNAYNYVGLANLSTSGVIYVPHTLYGNQTISLTGSAHITANTAAGAFSGGIAAGTVTAAQLGNVSPQAVGNFTFFSKPALGGVFTLGGASLTAVAADASAGQFNIGSDQNSAAINLAAAINADATMSTLVTAAQNSRLKNVVDITALTPGAGGNSIALSWTQGGSIPDGVVGGGSTGSNSSTLAYGSAWLQCSSKILAPTGAAFADIYPAVNASFLGTAYFSDVHGYATA